MPALDANRRRLAARNAAAARWDKPDRAEIARDLAAARLAAYIKATVDAAPDLSPSQRDRLAILLRGGESA